MAVRVGVAEAATRLMELLERAAAGEVVEIHWGGGAPMRLTPDVASNLFGEAAKAEEPNGA